MQAIKTGLRVLLVEDEPLIRMVLAEAMTDDGMSVTEASTGDAAAALIDGPDGFDLVLTDVQMPGTLDGIAVGRHARNRHPGIPIVYMTGRPDTVQGIGPLGAAEALLRKPFTLSEVLAVIRRLLSRAPRG